MADYSLLSRAQLSYDYLHTNSTTHEFLFGAMAELVDNSRDANATKINIFSEKSAELRGGFILHFLDDGQGMDPEEMMDVVTFGKSMKRNEFDASKIGMYGNGLKSGSMRLGNDMIIFSKRNNTLSCLLLARTFHEEELIGEVIVPLPSFNQDTREPIVEEGYEQKHNLEMDIIYRYSPYHTKEEFFAQFDRIDSKTGTLVTIYNMKLLDCGIPELDVLTDPNDILLTNTTLSGSYTIEGMMPERKSFRAYTSILYMEPRMRVYVQNRKVRTKKLASGLYKPQMYKYSSYRFKARSDNEAKKSHTEAQHSEERAREAVSKAANLEKKYGSSVEHRIEVRKAQTYAEQCKKEAALRKDMANRKNKALKEPKTLNLIFGINIENRDHDGTFVYNCSRLIKMYEKVGRQIDGGVYCNGVVGIVDVPYLVLEPTHNKQDFADAKEYRHLLKIMGECMEEYWKNVGIVQQGVTKFWENFGYNSTTWTDPPSTEPKFARKRAMHLQTTLQCDKCLKWRTIPFNSNSVDNFFPDEWVCELNSNASQARCTAPEQKLNIPEGTLKKEVKTQEDQQRKIEEDIRKKQEQLAKLQKNKPSTTPRPHDRPRVQLTTPPKKRDASRSPSPEPKRPPTRKPQVAREASRSQSPEPRRAPNRKVKQPSPDRSKSPSPEPRRAPNRKAKSPSPVAKSKPKPAPSKPSPKPVAKPSPKPSVSKTPVSSKPAPVSKPAPSKPAAKPSPKITASESAKSKEKSSVTKPATKPTTPVEKTKEVTSKEAKEKTQKSTDIKNNNNKKAVVVIKPVADDLPDISRNDASPRPTTSRSKEVPTKPTSVENKKRSAPSSTPTPPAKTITQEKSTTSDNKKRRDVSPAPADPSPAKKSRQEKPSETASTNNITANSSNHTESIKVKAKVSDTWHDGTVVDRKEKSGKVKVKFDKNPKDKCDMWYDKDSKELRWMTPSGDAAEPENAEAKTDGSEKMEATSDDVATISVNSEATVVPNGEILSEHDENFEKLVHQHKMCLRYFMPPQWVIDKDTVKNMTVPELLNISIDDFFDKYEKGLRKLVGNFQSETVTAKETLSKLRKNVAKLLRTINDEFDIDPEMDTPQVDELLAACMANAQASQT